MSARSLRSNAMLVVYAIKNTLNGHRYVGSSNCHERRFADHRKMLMAGRHHCAHLQRAWNLYGEDAFVFEAMEIVAVPSILRAREQFWTDATPKAERYNSAPDARRGPGMAGKRHSEESKKLIRSKRLLQPITARMLSALRGAHAGHSHSAESRARMSESARRRVVHGHTGYRHSAATKRRISEKKSLQKIDALLAVWEMCA